MNNSPDNVMKFYEVFRKSYKPEIEVSYAAALIEALLAVEKREMTFEEVKEGIGIYYESLENLGINLQQLKKS